MNDYIIDFNNPGRVHFIGIGGISMSGLAKLLIHRGFTVSGSDSAESAMTVELSSKGAKIGYPQKAQNIPNDVDAVVYTAAIHPDNQEFIRAREMGVPMLTRSRLLGQIMEHYKNSIAVAGTHGKTTTTSMLSSILLDAKTDPTISVGGIMPEIGGNFLVGNSDIFITEACEYTNSYHDFYPMYSVILNIDADHLDFFKDLSDIRSSFARFAGNTKSEGVLVISKAVENPGEIEELTKSRIVTAGTDTSCTYRAADINFNKLGCATYTLLFKNRRLGEIELSVAGTHNVTNSVCAAAVAHQMGFIPFDSIANGLRSFHGADRRFQYKGCVNGIDIYDDYAHHPTEIRATLSTARLLHKYKRIICIFQPHTYTRTAALFDEIVDALSDADIIIMAEIFAARETNELGISSSSLCDKLKSNGKEAYYFQSLEEIEKFFPEICINGDLLITMGAGDIVKVADDLTS